MLGKLEIINGEQQGTCVLIRNGESWSIGRSAEADFRINDDHMSRIHCAISNENDTFYIRNRGSRNGCHLNGKRLEDFQIQPGDLVRIGHTMFEFSIALSEEKLFEAPPPSTPQLSEQFLSEVKEKALKELKQNYHEQLKEAGRKQLVMLPSAPSIPGIEMDTVFLPAEIVSGDFYDFIHLPQKNRLSVVVGDITGHGYEAGIVMGAARKTINFCGKQFETPHETTVAANDELLPDLDEKTFCSLFYATLDIQTREFRFIRAGHNPLLLMNPRRKPAFQEFNPKGMVLGMVKGARFGQLLEEMSIQLMPGDMLLQYTDGIFEAMNEKNEEWGTNNFYAVVKKYGNTTPKHLLQKLVQSVQEFCGTMKQGDDITLLALKVL
jgi:serine phosphatase RsbU (regulator of sigma subunit)